MGPPASSRRSRPAEGTQTEFSFSAPEHASAADVRPSEAPPGAARTTLIVFGRHALREHKLAAARERRHGLQVLTIEQVAARLAGGLASPIDDETLRTKLETVLKGTQLGELDSLKSLPGMVGATVETLQKAWAAGLDLSARAHEHPRIASMARIEAAVLKELPPAMLRPAGLVERALSRLTHAPAVLGPTEIHGFTEASPCWRPLLAGLAAHVPVRWVAGPRQVPGWLSEPIEIVRSPRCSPRITTVSAATAHHETIEALRWARALIASGRAEPSQIALAAASPGDYDDHFLALKAESNIDLHFVHGVRVVSCREGQAAAALADVLVRGLSHTGVRRLAALLSGSPGPFSQLPEGWTRVLPAAATLRSRRSWERLLARLSPSDWPDGVDHAATVRQILDLLEPGISEVAACGEALLEGRARSIWRKALIAGPGASIDLTLSRLTQDDGLDACVSLAWMPAASLAASPRPFVRLLGLNSGRWPRGISEDRLLSDHIIRTRDLDPLPVSAADRRDFDTILLTTPCEVVLSFARRDSEGRLLGRSTLLSGQPPEKYLSRNRTPEAAYSEADRLTARRQDFRALPQGACADACWRDWHLPILTPHDGLVRPGHPLIKALLERRQSASSLRQLLRNPLGFVWQYGLSFTPPESGEDPLVLDALDTGNLVHHTLDRALRILEGAGGLAAAAPAQIERAVHEASRAVADAWESEHPVPPKVIWQKTLADTRELSHKALSFEDEPLPGSRSTGEVPFGGAKPRTEGRWPWNILTPVSIPECGFAIEGYIDRIDIAGDGRHARVRDYKTGRAPKDPITLDGGKELQRALYAFAVKALLGSHVQIDASLLYVREGMDLRLADPEGTLKEVARHLRAARESLLAGNALPGVDAEDPEHPLAFALPANAGPTYYPRKHAAVIARLGSAAQIWEVK
jgi:hypothetical protein